LIVGDRQPDLLQVVGALRTPGCLTSCLDGGQKQGDQDCNDGDYHQQLNESETAVASRTLHGSTHERLLSFKNEIDTRTQQYGTQPLAEPSRSFCLPRPNHHTELRQAQNPENQQLATDHPRCDLMAASMSIAN
jgi:hypothetical protein